jgi:O-antigen ligase
MTRVRWKWQLTLFVLFGASAALIMSFSRYDLAITFIVAAILGVAFLPGVVATLIESARAHLHGFTWWQGVWLLLFVSGLVFRDRGLQMIQEEALDSWALFRIFFVGVSAMLLLVMTALRRSEWPRYLFRGLVACIAAHSIVCILSTLWSVFPAWTGYKSCEFFVDIAALAAVVASAKSAEAYKRLFDWTWTMLAMLLLSVWMGLLLWPQEALFPSNGILGVQLAGVMPDVNANSVGEIGAVLGLVAICRLLRSNNGNSERVWYGGLLAFALASMALAQARSGILGFFAGLVLVLLVTRRVKMGLGLLAAGLVVFMASPSALNIFSDFMRRGETQEELYSLSSRVEWWSLAWPAFLEHPFSGYGAFAGARFFVMAGSGVDAAGIHSDWVEMLVGTGLVGFIPAFLAFAGTWRYLIKPVQRTTMTSLERQLRIEGIGVLAVMSVRSTFSNALFWHPPIVFFAILAYAQWLMMRRNRVRVAESSLVGSA